MSKVARISHLDRIRTKSQLTQQEVADLLGVQKSDVARWEKDLSGASPAQLCDLAVALDVSVEAIRGAEMTPEELQRSMFAIDRNLKLPFGTLRLTFASHHSQYPIDESARESLLAQLEKCDPSSPDDESTWFHTWTMDNLLLFINRDYLHQLELIGDDEQEMPDFSHPEVYRALESWDVKDEEIGPLLRSRCDAVIGAIGHEAAVEQARNARLVSASGTESWHFMLDEEDALGLYELELDVSASIARNRFMRTRSEGYYISRFVNLSQVALIEVPANCYHRLNAPQ